MTGVVLRCPNCGTTRSAPGECEACHEAQVRYFCTNHSPGEWLDGPTCRRCGAKFGDRPVPPAPAPRPTRPAPPLSPAGKKGRAPAPSGRPVPAEPPSPWGRRSSRSTEARSGRSGSDGPRVVWRRLPDFRRGPWRLPPGSEDDVGVSGPTPGGCLRFLIMAALFFLLAMLALSLLMGDMAMRVFVL